jgi:hypothetical protein
VGFAALAPLVAEIGAITFAADASRRKSLVAFVIRNPHFRW